MDFELSIEWKSIKRNKSNAVSLATKIDDTVIYVLRMVIVIDNVRLNFHVSLDDS